MRYHREVRVNGERVWVPVDPDYVWRDNGCRGGIKRAVRLTPEGHRQVLLDRVERARAEGRGAW